MVNPTYQQGTIQHRAPPFEKVGRAAAFYRLEHGAGWNLAGK